MESFSHENTKRRKTEVTTKGGKVDRKMMRDMENLAIEDVTVEDWKMDDGSLEEALGTMNLDKAVKDIVWEKISKARVVRRRDPPPSRRALRTRVTRRRSSC